MWKVKAPKRTASRVGPGRRGRGALEDVADAQQQFAGLERLGQIVVGADLEARDAVIRLGPRGQHEDRHIRGRSRSRAARSKPFSPGIMTSRIKRSKAMRLRLGAGVLRILRRGDAIAVLGQKARQQVADAVVVVDDAADGARRPAGLPSASSSIAHRGFATRTSRSTRCALGRSTMRRGSALATAWPAGPSSPRARREAPGLQSARSRASACPSR